MPEPGDPYASAFVCEVGQCWRMIHDRQGQATHCPEAPSWTGRWHAYRLASSGGGFGPVLTIWTG